MSDNTKWLGMIYLMIGGLYAALTTKPVMWWLDTPVYGFDSLIKSIFWPLFILGK